MSIVNQLASQLNRKDEEPNIELAQKLVTEHNLIGIQEVIDNLSNKDKKLREREEYLTLPQLKRVKKVYRILENY